MATSEEHYRLDQAPNGLGLCCEDTGVSLAGVSLLRKTATGYAPRPAREISTLIKGAYGRETDAMCLIAGLRVAADALNRGDIGRAMIAAPHLRLPELSVDAAESLIQAEDILAKYDPDEPRDRRGR